MRRTGATDRRIGRLNVNFRPFEIDLKEIDILTRNEYKGNQSDTLRELVREALVRRRLVREGKDATMSIVKDSQAQVIDARLHPLIKQIDELSRTIKSLIETNENLAKGITNSATNLASEITQIHEKISSLRDDNQPQYLEAVNQQLAKLTATLQPMAAGSATTLKNIIAIRSLFYVFLLGYQSGSIEEANKLSRAQWVYFVRDVQKKLNTLSFEEYNSLDPLNQHKFIEDYARQIFEQIRIVKQTDIPKL